MRALILEAPGILTLREVETPTPGPGELLIQVKAATTCGTDLKAFRRGHPQIPMPGPFGHEYSGIVVEAGEGARFDVGDAVMGVHSAPCQSCFWCAHGQENLCESIMATKVLGSYAEFLLIPERIASLNVFKKPEHLSFAEASLLEPLSCVAQGVLTLGANSHRMGTAPPTVLILGPGAIGLMFVAALRHYGCNVTLAGRNALRLAVGKTLGAQTVPFDEVSPASGRGYDIVIECTGQVSVWEQSINWVRRGGKLMLFGGPPGGTRVSFDTHRLHYDEITVLSPFHFGTAAVRLAHDWLTGGMDLSALISGRRKLEDGSQIFDDLHQGLGIKYVVEP